MNGFEVIGHGSYGYVLKHQGCALKVSSEDDEIHSRDIVHELWILSLLGNHSNIVGAKGIWKTSRDLALEIGIVMDLCVRPLSDAIKKQDIIEDDLFDLTKQLTRGVAYLASKGIVHCDLSTDNVLIDQRGDLRITDFGMSRVLTKPRPRTPFNELITSQTVRAPELFTYNILSPRFNKNTFPNQQIPTFGCEIDVWALGCIVYSMWQGTKVPGHFFVNDAHNQDSYLKSSKIDKLRLCLESIEENLKFVEFSSSTMKPWLARFFEMTLVMDPCQRPTANTILNELFEENVGVPSTQGNLEEWVKSKGAHRLQVSWLVSSIESLQTGYPLVSETEFLLKNSGFEVFEIPVPSHQDIQDSIESEESE